MNRMERKNDIAVSITTADGEHFHVKWEDYITCTNKMINGRIQTFIPEHMKIYDKPRVQNLDEHWKL